MLPASEATNASISKKSFRFRDAKEPLPSNVIRGSKFFLAISICKPWDFKRYSASNKSGRFRKTYPGVPTPFNLGNSGRSEGALSSAAGYLRKSISTRRVADDNLCSCKDCEA